MKLLYLVNLFFVCCSSFIVQPGYLPMKFKSSNINYNHKYKNLELLKKKELINLKNNTIHDYNQNKNNLLMVSFVFIHINTKIIFFINLLKSNDKKLILPI